MYKGIKSMIKINDMSTIFFAFNVGVRQGKNLSPFLFALYSNDLDFFLQEKGIVGLQSVTESIEDELLILLYADETVLMAESADDLQCAFIFYIHVLYTVEIERQC